MTLEEFLGIFCHRRKPYAIQNKKGNYYTSQHEKMQKFMKDHKLPESVDSDVLSRHSRGEITIGTYLISENNTCRCLCLDIDAKDPKEKLASEGMFQQVREELTKLKIPFLQEETGGRGLHFWIIFERSQAAEFAYSLSQKLRYHIKKELNLDVEVFPKQGGLDKDNLPLGNLVKVPLGTHQKYGRKSCFCITVEGKAVFEQVKNIQVIYYNPTDSPLAKVKIEQPKVATTGKTRMPCTDNMMAGCSEGEGRDETALRLAVRFDRAGLDKADAWDLLQKFNDNCTPPLSDSVLEKKLNQGYKGYSLGCNSPLIEQYCDPSCFLYEQVKHVSYEEDELIPDKGFLQYYLKYNKRNDAPRIFHLITGLFLISSVIKNRVWADPFGASKLYPNLYVLFVAPSGNRKTVAMNKGKDVITGFDGSILMPDSIASYEAYLTCFTRRPQATFVLSEFSRFMRRLTRENMGGVKDIITEVYDCPPTHTIFSKGEDHTTINGPCYNIIAGCTPVFLEEDTKPSDWQEGFFSRFIVISAVRKVLKGVSARTKEEEDMRLFMLDWFDKIEKIKGLVDLSAVQDDLNKAAKKYSKVKNELLDGFYERTTDYLIKFSILYNISLGHGLKITPKALGYAKKLFSYLEQTYAGQLNDLSLTKESKDINRVFRVIRDEKDFGISKSKLLQRTGFYANKLGNILRTLIEAGRIREEKTNTGAHRYYIRKKEEK